MTGTRVTSPSLTVLLYGDFLPDRLGASYRRAFERLGHRVVPVDVRDARRYLAPWLQSRIGHRLTKRSAAMRRMGSTRWNGSLVDAARTARPDLTLILNGEWVMPATVRALRALGTRVFLFHADNPFPGHSSSRPENIVTAMESDCYLIWSRVLADRLRDRGVPRVEYLQFAWDEDVFPHIEMPPEPAYDLVFVGGWDRERESVLEPIAREFDLKIWGPPYWGSRSRPGSSVRRCWQGRAVAGREAAGIIASARVTLNVLRRQNLPDGAIMRTFEVPGIGGISLSTRTQGATEIFPEGMAGAYFADVAESMTGITWLLDHPGQAREMARSAHEIVRNGHRYDDRARSILAVYGQL